MPLEYVDSLGAGPFAAIRTSEGFVLAVVNAGNVNGVSLIPGVNAPVAQINVTPMVISSGQSVSSAKNFYGATIFKFVFPAAWTTASLTFLESESENGTYTSVYSDSAERTISAAAANRTIRVYPADYFSVKWLKIRSGTAATPVNQGQNTTVLVYSYVL